MTRRFLIFVAAATLYIPGLLLADSRGWIPQLALGLTTAAFLMIFGPRGDKKQIITAIIVATTGEIVLSLGWGLYTYRNALIPLYVPVGHGVFYALAAESARQEKLKQHARAITRCVLIAGTIIATFGLIALHDQWGFLWWAGAAILLMRSRNQLLLSACFTYTIFLEWLGTWIGNWHWSAIVPGIGLRSANPPSGVGILYILLDLITVGICSIEVRKWLAPLGNRTHNVPHVAGSLLRSLEESGSTLRRTILHRGEDDGHLLPSDLPGAHAIPGERALLPDGSSG